MPTRRDVLKAGGGLAVLSALPMPTEGADAQDVSVQVAVSGPSFGTRTPLGTTRSDYANIKNKLGCSIIRNSVQWSNFEASKGSYNWGNLDRLVDACQTVGLRILISISGPKPGWAGGNFGPPLGADLASYVRACREIAMRYRGRGTVEAYEVWNEPNIKGWSAAQYVTVINAVAPAIKAADPNVLVAGPGMSQLPGDQPEPRAFAAAILANAQARANLDVYTGHAYCRPAPPEVGTDIRGPFDPRIAASLMQLVNSGFHKRFWVSEMGWRISGSSGPPTCTPAEQARYIVRGAVIIRAHGVRVYQFEYKGEHGLVDQQSFAAYNTLLRVVGNGLTSLTKISHPTAWVYKYTRTAKPAGYILWTVSGTANVSLTGLTPTVRRTTLSGSQTIVRTFGSALTVAAKIDPVYIENI